MALHEPIHWRLIFVLGRLRELFFNEKWARSRTL